MRVDVGSIPAFGSMARRYSVNVPADVESGRINIKSILRTGVGENPTRAISSRPACA